ncbi:hypothetical protein ACFL3S_05565 [Gemmatimonadota bacterium]
MVLDSLITSRLTEEEKRLLQALAARRKTRVSQLVRRLVQDEISRGMTKTRITEGQLDEHGM